MNRIIHKLHAGLRYIWEYTRFSIHVALFRKKNAQQPKRTILVVSHELTISGAPMVLMPLLSYLAEKGDSLTVLSLADGPLRKELKKKKIPVFVPGRKLFFLKKTLPGIAKHFSFVLCNSIAVTDVVSVLVNAPVDVLWWIHEGRLGLDVFKHTLPDKITDNIHLLAVSEYARKCLRTYCPSWPDSQVFMFGVADNSIDISHSDSKRFSVICVGAIEKRKGQDLLYSVIKDGKFEKTDMYFVGRVTDEEFYSNNIFESTNIHYCGELTHAETLNAIGRASLVCVPSREESVSAVTIEAMMLSVPVLVSTNCGIASYIEDGVNGFLFESGSVDDLQLKLNYIRSLPEDKLNTVAKMGRQTYERCFTIRHCIESFETIVENTLGI